MILIRIGVFRRLGISKKELLWLAHWKVNGQPHSSVAAILFALEEPKLSLPVLTPHVIEDAYDELELLSFTLGSPFSLLAEIPTIPTILVTAQDLPHYLSKVVSILGYLVNRKLPIQYTRNLCALVTGSTVTGSSLVLYISQE